MSVRILIGDILERIAELADKSVHCVVTSPPYWGLRDYGTDGQIGLEATPEEHVKRMVGVFREVRRVMRDDATLWLNYGDSYASWGTERAKKQSRGRMNEERPIAGRIRAGAARYGLKHKDLIGMPWRVAFGLQADGWYLRSDIIWAKPNPMPESVTDRPTKSHEHVFLFAKGQWSTTVIQFANLPSEVAHFRNDRRLCTSDSGACALCVRLASAIFDFAQFQEQMTLPSLDSEVWEKSADDNDSAFVRGCPSKHGPTVLAARFLRADITAKEFLCEFNRLWVALTDRDELLKCWVPSVLSDPPGIYRYGKGTIAVKDAGKICKIDLSHGEWIVARPSGCVYHYDADAVREPFSDTTVNDARFGNPAAQAVRERNRGGRTDGYTTPAGGAGNPDSAGRNLRDVWTIPTHSFPGAHFATFPPKLVEPCIKAGCPEDGTVLDPFGGAGTVGLVADQLQRNAILIELNEEYARMADRRIREDCPMFTKTQIE